MTKRVHRQLRDPQLPSVSQEEQYQATEIRTTSHWMNDVVSEAAQVELPPSPRRHVSARERTLQEEKLPTSFPLQWKPGNMTAPLHESLGKPELPKLLKSQEGQPTPEDRSPAFWAYMNATSPYRQRPFIEAVTQTVVSGRDPPDLAVIPPVSTFPLSTLHITRPRLFRSSSTRHRGPSPCPQEHTPVLLWTPRHPVPMACRGNTFQTSRT